MNSIVVRTMKDSEKETVFPTCNFITDKNAHFGRKLLGITSIILAVFFVASFLLGRWENVSSTVYAVGYPVICISVIVHLFQDDKKAISTSHGQKMHKTVTGIDPKDMLYIVAAILGVALFWELGTGLIEWIAGIIGMDIQMCSFSEAINGNC